MPDVRKRDAGSSEATAEICTDSLRVRAANTKMAADNFSKIMSHQDDRVSFSVRRG